jgi:hypothetical protein
MNAAESAYPALPLTTPVVFIVFNRPDCTMMSLAAIRAVRPQWLYVVADGPREDRAGEVALCAAVRAVVDRGIDWPCEVLRDYAPAHLGCARRVSSGLDGVFACEKTAIILEDDCVPEPTFFRYAEELLDYYQTDPRVFVVSGTNQQFRDFTCPHSYFFSRYNHCWGWATWARAWRHFDFTMKTWPDFVQSGELASFFRDPNLTARWRDILDPVARGEVDSWAYRWVFACWRNGALSALPRRALVKNIGFDKRATHTRRVRRELRELVTEPMRFPLVHPPRIERNAEADRHTEAMMYRSPSWPRRLLAPVRRVLGGT